MDQAKSSIAKYFPSISLIDFNNPTTQVCIRNYGIAAACLLITSIVVYKAITVPNINKDQFYLYAVFAILPIIAGTFVISPLFSDSLNPRTAMLYGSMSFLLVIALFYFYTILYPSSVGMVSRVIYMLSILGVIVALSMIYKIFFRFIQNLRGWSGFILRFIFFIPCLLIDLLEALYSELKSAPTMIAVLFVLEILIVLAYFYAPNLIAYLYNQNSVNLLNQPVFLNKQSVIAKSDMCLLDPTDPLNPTGNNGPEDKNVPTYRKNYGISMWIYVNPMTTNNPAYAKETTIFKYGLSSEPGKPQITYVNKVDPVSNTNDNYYIYVSNKNILPRLQLQLPGQTWNYIVINYNESTVDLFVNGNLEQTHRIEPSDIPDYRSTDVMSVGEGDGSILDGGLYGAISNVNYYKNPLTQMQITSSYNALRYKNPPIN